MGKKGFDVKKVCFSFCEEILNVPSCISVELYKQAGILKNTKEVHRSELVCFSCTLMFCKDYSQVLI